MKNVLIIMGLVCAQISAAQFTDSTMHLINFASTGVINKTNTSSSYVFTNALKGAVRKKHISLNSNTTWVYGWQQAKLTNNDFSSALDFNLYKTLPHFYYWGLAAYDKNYSLKTNSRLQAGIGVAYSFVDGETAYFNISNGILYEASNLKITDSTNDVYRTFRNSLRMRHRLVLKNMIVLDGMHFWQPSLNSRADNILKSNTTLSVKLIKWLSVTALANYNRVSRTQRESLLISFGLAVEKYF